ncbi:glycoside hydrolase family 16 protein [Aspergillus aculeatinus CBS 121060]|uniref:Cell wall glucanase n=1 Tax=Aspergillus aculeatinus CBS 121060 TaxID=1448322 RepID=A0ACD1HIT8_9EURO|nr:cell wall glucanase [Aspergillus aculeatinus CBS 121060]RAH73351.1 cell wall glucanase [Aspergillus aculeatinus CBS 121060]
MQLHRLRAVVGLFSYLSLATAQTYTSCNPTESTCPADTALGKSASFDFTQGSSSDFEPTGTPTYSDDGVAFTVAKEGDAPLIQSKWYIMFGRVEYVIKAAPGTGIVSSAILQSDDLDEIDWEWLGGNNNLVQSNYFGKGATTPNNRGATHDVANNHDEFHTYTIDWTDEQIVWQIDGKTVRVLTPETANANQYPQSPMVVKVGIWAGGDPNNAQGTIDWAGGETDYSAGPYTMYMKSLKVTDYSTGSSYTYSDKSGLWTSITSDGGKINGNINADTISSVQSAPTITATVSIPIPWPGTHRETSSYVTPDVWPWVTGTGAAAAYTGSWSYSSSGQVQPPSAASVTFLPVYISLLAICAGLILPLRL